MNKANVFLLVIISSLLTYISMGSQETLPVHKAHFLRHPCSPSSIKHLLQPYPYEKWEFFRGSLDEFKKNSRSVLVEPGQPMEIGEFGRLKVVVKAYRNENGLLDREDYTNRI